MINLIKSKLKKCDILALMKPSLVTKSAHGSHTSTTVCQKHVMIFSIFPPVVNVTPQNKPPKTILHSPKIHIQQPKQSYIRFQKSLFLHSFMNILVAQRCTKCRCYATWQITSRTWCEYSRKLCTICDRKIHSYLEFHRPTPSWSY